MNDELREKLSAYLDGALPAAEARALELDIAKSPELLRELEELKAVSKLVKDLPNEPLPVGFMQRLQRRRSGMDAPAEDRNWVFLSPTYRPFAAALSGLIVAVVVWDKVGEKTPVVPYYDGAAVMSAADAPPTQYDLADKISSGKSVAAESVLEGAAELEVHAPRVEVPANDKREDMVARRERVRAPGAPLADETDMARQSFAGGGGLSGAAPTAFAPDRAGAPTAKASVAAVRGMGAARPQTEEERSALNEEMYQAFEREKKKMGIAALVPKDETSERARRVLSAAGRNQPAAPIASPRPALLAKTAAPRGGHPALRSDVAYQAAWSSLLLPGQPPPVDFTTEMIVLLPEPGVVDSALESAGELVVLWTPTPGSPRDRLRAVPASMYPVRLMRQ